MQWVAESRRIIKVAVPLSIVYLIESMMAFVDSLFMGRFRADEIAGYGLGARIVFDAANVICLCVIGMVAVFSAKYDAIQNKRAVEVHVQHGFYMCVLLSLPVVLLTLNLGSLLLAFNIDPAVSFQADQYAQGAVYSILPLALFCVLRDHSAAVSDFSSIFYITLFASVFKAVISYALILGEFGFPRLGAYGAGLSTSLVSWGMLAAEIGLYSLSNRRSAKVYAIFTGWAAPKLSLIKKYLAMGLPLSANSLVISLMFIVLMFFTENVGTLELAAAQLVFSYIYPVFMLVEGVREAIAIRVAQEHALDNVHKVRKLTASASMVGMLFLLPFAFIVLFDSTLVASMFFDVKAPSNHDLLTQFNLIICLATLSIVVECVQVILLGALKGLEDTKVPFLINTTTAWLIGVAGGYHLAFNMDQGVVGLWVALILSHLLSLLMLMVRLVRVTKPNSPLLSASPTHD